MMNSHQKDVCTLCQMAWPICAMVKPYGIFMGYGHPTIINKGFIVMAIWTPIYRFIPIPQYRHWIPGPRHHGQPCREKKNKGFGYKWLHGSIKTGIQKESKGVPSLVSGLDFWRSGALLKRTCCQWASKCCLQQPLRTLIRVTEQEKWIKTGETKKTIWLSLPTNDLIRLPSAAIHKPAVPNYKTVVSRWSNLHG